MPRARSRRFSSAPAASACQLAEDLFGLRQILSGGPEADFDSQRHQVLLRPVVKVAFQPPPFLVLGGD